MERPAPRRQQPGGSAFATADAGPLLDVFTGTYLADLSESIAELRAAGEGIEVSPYTHEIGAIDYYPVTGAGKFIAACIAVLGIGMFALPAGLLGAGFVDELQARDGGERNCPNCGHRLDE